MHAPGSSCLARHAPPVSKLGSYRQLALPRSSRLQQRRDPPSARAYRGPKRTQALPMLNAGPQVRSGTRPELMELQLRFTGISDQRHPAAADCSGAGGTQEIAQMFFGASIVPYSVFLYFLTKSKQAPPLLLFGFYFLLVFVFATIPAGIVGEGSSGILTLLITSMN